MLFFLYVLYGFFFKSQYDEPNIIHLCKSGFVARLARPYIFLNKFLCLSAWLIAKNYNLNNVWNAFIFIQVTSQQSQCQDYRRVVCDINCNHAAVDASSYDAYLNTYQRLFVAHQNEIQNISSSDGEQEQNDLQFNTMSSNINFELCLADKRLSLVGNKSCGVSCRLDEPQPDCVSAETFWTFVCLMCLGTIGFNVGNSVSDATCFDVLGGLGGVFYSLELLVFLIIF